MKYLLLVFLLTFSSIANSEENPDMSNNIEDWLTNLERTQSNIDKLNLIKTILEDLIKNFHTYQPFDDKLIRRLSSIVELYPSNKITINNVEDSPYNSEDNLFNFIVDDFDIYFSQVIPNYNTYLRPTGALRSYKKSYLTLNNNKMRSASVNFITNDGEKKFNDFNSWISCRQEIINKIIKSKEESEKKRLTLQLTKFYENETRTPIQNINIKENIIPPLLYKKLIFLMKKFKSTAIISGSRVSKYNLNPIITHEDHPYYTHIENCFFFRDLFLLLGNYTYYDFSKNNNDAYYFYGIHNKLFGVSFQEIINYSDTNIAQKMNLFFSECIKWSQGIDDTITLETIESDADNLMKEFEHYKPTTINPELTKKIDKGISTTEELISFFKSPDVHNKSYKYITCSPNFSLSLFNAELNQWLSKNQHQASFFEFEHHPYKPISFIMNNNELKALIVTDDKYNDPTETFRSNQVEVFTLLEAIEQGEDCFNAAVKNVHFLPQKKSRHFSYIEKSIKVSDQLSKNILDIFHGIKVYDGSKVSLSPESMYYLYAISTDNPTPTFWGSKHNIFGVYFIKSWSLHNADLNNQIALFMKNVYKLIEADQRNLKSQESILINESMKILNEIRHNKDNHFNHLPHDE